MIIPIGLHAAVRRLFALAPAILAAGLLFGAAVSHRTVEDEVRTIAPKRISFRMIDGVRVVGDMTAWDRNGFDGSFGRRLWTELHPDDAWMLFVNVMNRESVEQWVELGRAFKRSENAERLAARAFDQARALDRGKADELIALVEEEIAAARAAKKQAERDQLNARSPEFGPWPDGPWPILTAVDQRGALANVRQASEKIAREAELNLKPIETARLLIYHEIDAKTATDWSVRMEQLLTTFCTTFNLAADHNPFWGKAVVFIFADHDQFRLTQASSLNQLVPLKTLSLTAYDGPRVFISLVNQANRFEFEDRVRQEITRAFLHRYRAPRRLPAWMNDGMAMYIGSLVYEEYRLPADLREQGLRLVRSGVNVRELLAKSWADADWPGPNNEGHAVALLAAGYLLEHHRPAVFAWINAIKDGQPWNEAMEEHFRLTPAQFFERITTYYRVND